MTSSPHYANLSCPATFISSNEIFLCGGSNGTATFILDLKLMRLIPKRPLPFKRSGHISLFYKNRVFVLGGTCEDSKECLSKCDVYDIDLDRWAPISEMNHRRKDFGACLLENE